jgi:hypothetical protein
MQSNISLYKKGKAVEALKCCERLRLPQFSDIWLPDGDKVVSSRHRPLFTPRKISGINFC